MLKNYINVALRNLWKNKEFSFINIVGLAIGISTCLLITLYVLDELSYDRFHEKADRITRLTPTLHMPKGDRPRAVTSPIMGPTLAANFPEIEKVARVIGSSRTLSFETTKIYDTKILYADSTLFDVFTYPMLKGNPKKALVNPYSIVLSEKAVKRYFGDNDPMGKTMALSDTITLSVTGVVKDVPANSHLSFDVLISRTTITEMIHHQAEDSWFNNNTYTYILLKSADDRLALEAKFPSFLKKQMASNEEDSGGLWYDFYLQPVTDIHLKSDLAAEIGPNGSIKYVYIFSVVGLMVLLIACANYINLATAKSVSRGKELGMRKVIGARRYQLITQLLGESFLTTSLATVLAAAIVTSSLSYFNDLTGKHLTIEHLASFDIIIVYAGIYFAISILAGTYPALVMSSFSAIKTLKNNIRHGKENILLRKGLVVFQFTLSIILITGTLLIFRQLDFIQHQNLGLDKEQMVHLKLRNGIIPKANVIREEMLRIPNVIAATASNFSYDYDLNNIAILPEGAADDQVSSEPVISVDYDFLNTFKIEMVAGRNFSKSYTTDEAEGFIVNQAAVKYFNWGTAEEALGKKIDWGLGKKGKVIGVVRDFNFASLHKTIRPLIIHLYPEWYDYVAVKVNGRDMASTLSAIESTWKSLNLDSPFDYSFMDKDFENLYKAEQQTRSIVSLLSSLAIFIACLGLFGLAAFTAEQRTKEIGVRKVLGADVMSIISLLSSDFIRLVLISIVLAVPIGWWTMSQWLAGFAYKIEISWWLFVIAGTSAILIALLTVSFQSAKAALTNPVKSLRSE